MTYNPNTNHLPDPPPYMVTAVYDESLGHIGSVIIDRPVRGVVSGGVRYLPSGSLGDLARIARAMTLKWAFLNVPMGGAKALIDVNPAQLGCERDYLMERFGRAIKALVTHQLYFPGVDLGTTDSDLQAIMRGAGLPMTTGDQIDASQATAMTAFETVRQTTLFYQQPLAGLRVALEGFGKVGSNLAGLLYQAGAKITTLSTVEGAIHFPDGLDVPRLLALKKQHGDKLIHHYPEAQIIEQAALFTQDVDVLIPGARPDSVNPGNIDRIRARFIIPFSNIPITPGLETALAERGIVYIPDYTVNCGGVLAVHMRSHYFNLEDVQTMIETTFAQVITAMLHKAAETGHPISEVAEAVAWYNHHEFNEPSAASSGKLGKVKHVLQEQGIDGIERRLAWRIHYRQHGSPPSLHAAAREHYAEFTLNETLRRIQTLQLA